VISTVPVPLRGSALLSPAIALACACLIALPSSAGAAPPEDAAVEQPPDELIPPKATAPVTYEYPPELLEREQPPAGTVTVQYVVGTDGVPKELELLEGVDPILDAAALAAVGSLRFEPASYAGEAVEVVLSISLAFTPPEPEPPGDGDIGDGDGGDTGDGGDGGEEPEQGPVRIVGELLEAGRGAPVGGATVLAIPGDDYPVGKVRQKVYGEEPEPTWMIKALSRDDGGFELRGVPDGRVRLIMLAPNFDRLEWVVELEAGKQLETKYFLERNADNPYRTEVAVERETMPEAVVRTITPEQVNEIPGTYGDALKAVQNFPSVARAPFGAGLLSIRGAAPADSGVFLGYHEIPTLFHFGALVSVFNSDILAQIDFIPGNFDARYGDAIGGIINVQPRKGRRDGYHGYVDTDLFDTGLLVEGKVGKGSFILSGRRSYVDLILPLVIPDEVGLGLTLAPRYWDYQGLFDYPVAGGELSVRVFGSDDRTRLLFAEQNDVSDEEANSLETIQWFHRVDTVYRKVEGPWEFLITPSYKREFWSSNIFGDIRFHVESDTLSARAEISRQLSKNARLRIGADFTGTWYRGKAELPGFDGSSPSPGLSSAATRETGDTRAVPGLYATLTLRVAERLLLYPGLRLNFYAGDLGDATVDPRLRFILSINEKTRLKGGVGQYSQAPGLLQTDEVFGNARLRPERSLHTSLGIDRDLPWDVNVELTGFYKRLWNLGSPSTTLRWTAGQDYPLPENFANVGTGHVFGGELLVRKQLSNRFYGWLSYTLMRSVRTPAPGEPQRLFEFDQTHILTIIASYDFKYNWRIGARFRVVSGNPYTPITDAIPDASTGSYIPIEGPINSARMPAFHQLDLRVDKSWVYRRVRVTSYLDILNVYNAQNVELYNFSYDYRVKRPVYSLPTAPSIGLKVEW
jgi:TonB family protein